MSKITRAITEEGGIVVSFIDSTDIVSRFENVHKTSAVVTAASGRLLTAASLMGIEQKNEKDIITLRVDGDGLIGSIVVSSDSFGNVKGYCKNKIVEIPLNENNKLDVKTAVGKGVLSVVKSVNGNNYTGQVELVSGEIAEDINNYYLTSEQSSIAIALGVLINPDLTVRKAGGFFVHVLPFSSEEELFKVEENLKVVTSVTSMMEKGMNENEIIEIILKGFKHNILDEHIVEYKCDCSKSRVCRALKSLSKDEKQSMAKDSVTEVTCQFCDNVYTFSSEEILGFI